MYTSLDPARIVETADGLRERIAARFPSSSLSKVAVELAVTCAQAAALSAWLARPLWRVRAVAVVASGLLLATLLSGLLNLEMQSEMGTAASSVWDLLQGVEAAVNNAVFLGIAVFFLLGWENRYKRKRALAAMHALRSLAHIIDMHQLGKDPAWLHLQDGAAPLGGPPPKRAMTAHELTCYLDYCADLLSVISKVAALYVQRFPDTPTLAAVDEVEGLTSGLSRKIWQKIVILDRPR